MTRRRLSGDEQALWQAATADVRRLSRRSTAVAAPGPAAPANGAPVRPPPLQAGPTRPHHDAATHVNGHSLHPLPALGPGETIGLDRRRMERLKRGQLSIDGVVDLHGMTQEAAHRLIERYVPDSVAQGRRCILVVTGKGAISQGGGVLRRRLVEWLNQPTCRPHVVAFVQAQPQHGGAGAYYILLRRQRPQ